MAKYRVSETVACWVTWESDVEADSQEEAERMMRDGECPSESEAMIGDAINGYDTVVEVKLLS